MKFLLTNLYNGFFKGYSLFSCTKIRVWFCIHVLIHAQSSRQFQKADSLHLDAAFSLWDFVYSLYFGLISCSSSKLKTRRVEALSTHCSWIRQSHLCSLLAHCSAVSCCNRPRWHRSSQGIVDSLQTTSSPLELEYYRLVKLPWPVTSKTLTAVILIRVVHAVLYMVTSVLAGDALALPAGELVWAAGPSAWTKNMKLGLFQKATLWEN